MSEISNHIETNSQQIYELTIGFLEGKNGEWLVKNYQTIIDKATPTEVIMAFDKIMQANYALSEVKKAVNKVMNLLFKSINEQPIAKPVRDSYLYGFFRNNSLMAEKLNDIRPLIKPFNIHPGEERIKTRLIKAFIDLQEFRKQYLLKENVLFPIIERYLAEHRCLKIMWSFHDDINRNLKRVIEELSLEQPDVKNVNRLIGLIFFNMLAIKFREEKVLYPFIMQLIPDNELQKLTQESLAMGYAYYTPPPAPIANMEIPFSKQQVDLGTGLVTVEQIKLIFNHLPVDITYVDEHDKVQFFSTPPNRIFPRSKAIIGRSVQNCHPKESIEIVNRIVASFKAGEKNRADFWIKMGNKMLLIQYFVVRDEQQIYRGVIEVSQEISEIQSLQGEKRLLDW